MPVNPFYDPLLGDDKDCTGTCAQCSTACIGDKGHSGQHACGSHY